MKNPKLLIIIAIGLLWIHTSAEIPEFKEHVLFKVPGSMGKTGFGDFDNDGLLDFTTGKAGGDVSWYRNPGELSGVWEKFTIDESNGGCVGGEPADVDGDGLVDFISHGIWYRNSKENPGKSFEKFSFHSGGVPGRANGCHDFIAADIDKDGDPDAMNHAVNWWRNPGGDAATKTWETYVVVPNSGYWGAIAPYGFGDIDGDGDNDVVGIGNWFKNVDGDGKTWEKVAFSSWSNKIENRTWVADLDGDGDQDIAQAEGDKTDGTAAWHQNLDGKGGEWKTIEFPGIEGDLHSVGVADFDLDGDNDIYVAQNARGISVCKWFIMENTDGKGTFEQRLIYEGYGAHESIYADFDGDGDTDIMSKCWCGGGAAVILENMLALKPPAAPGTVTAAMLAGNKVEISWAPPAGDSGKTLSYIVYRNDVALDTVSAVKFVDSTIQAGVPYSYSISALLGKQEGAKSVPQAVTGINSMYALKNRLAFRALVAQSGGEAVLEVSANMDGKFSIELYDLHGARHAYQSGQGQQIRHTIPLQTLKDGVYLVRLNAFQGSGTKKIILNR